MRDPALVLPVPDIEPRGPPTTTASMLGIHVAGRRVLRSGDAPPHRDEGATMTSRQHIIELEEKFWRTMVDRDVDTATGMMADTAIVTSAQGAAMIDSGTFARMMKEGTWKLHSFKLDKPQVKFNGGDMAIIGYEVTEKLTVDDKPLELIAYDASVWIRVDGEWKCALHTESVKGDPFGRDPARA
jgi:ketosteroid isomerase-like protein